MSVHEHEYVPGMFAPEMCPLCHLERRLAESEAGAARMRAELLFLRELVSDPERKSIDRVIEGEE